MHYGFRNRDRRPLLFGTGQVSAVESCRQASVVTRQPRLLRGHGLIRKVPKPHRYVLTERGQSAIAALLVARQETADATVSVQLAPAN